MGSGATRRGRTAHSRARPEHGSSCMQAHVPLRLGIIPDLQLNGTLHGQQHPVLPRDSRSARRRCVRGRRRPRRHRGGPRRRPARQEACSSPRDTPASAANGHGRHGPRLHDLRRWRQLPRRRHRPRGARRPLGREGAREPARRQRHPRPSCSSASTTASWPRRACSFSLMTQVVDVVAKDGHIEQAICHAKSGFFAVSAKMFRRRHRGRRPRHLRGRALRGRRTRTAT